MKEVYNFNEYLRKFKGDFREIDELSKTVINKKENRGQLFLRALGENHEDDLAEALHNTEFGSSTIIDKLVSHNEQCKPLSTSLINKIMKDIQPTFTSNHQLKKEPYITEINKYFNFKSQTTKALKYGGKGDALVLSDNATKTSLVSNKKPVVVDEEVYELLNGVI